jgi:hypothetical protein
LGIGRIGGAGGARIGAGKTLRVDADVHGLDGQRAGLTTKAMVMGSKSVGVV